MKARALLLSVLAMIPMLMAAWPDIYPQRRAAMAALQYDLVYSVGHDAEVVAEKYQFACKKGFQSVCSFKDWQGAEGGDLAKAGAFFGRRCGGEPLGCVVSAWAKSRVDGVVSPDAPDPAGAFRMMKKTCKTDLYAPACTTLGELYLAGAGTTQDDTLAREAFAEGCKAEDWYGCYLEATMVQAGRGGAQRSTERAAALHEMACDNGVTNACGELAVLVEAGDGALKDVSRAASLYGQACREREMGACYELGRLYAGGKGVTGSPVVALGLFQTVCELGDLRGCFGLGTLFEEGKGVAADVERARSYYNDACEASFAPACSRLGKMYLQGRQVEKDIDLGLRYVQRGCRAGDIEGCLSVGRMYEEGRWVNMNLTRAVDLYKQACEGGGGAGCYELGRLYDEGKGVPPNQAQAMTLYHQACDQEHGASCGALALKFRDGEGVAQDTLKSVGFLKQACDMLDGPSCAVLGEMYETGTGAGKDVEKAVAMYKVACNQQDPLGCYRLGLAYENGYGIEQDYYLALRSYAVACEQDVEEACRAAEPITLQARFEGVVREAFDSRICEVWGFDSQDPEANKMLVEVQGDRMTIHAGDYAGTSAKIRHVRNGFEEGRTYTARSFWTVEINEKVVGTEFEHHEVWRSDREDVDAFPGDESFSKDVRGASSLLYSREDETVRRNQSGRCEFVDQYAMLTSEQCSEVQALLAANLVSTCR